MTNQERNQSGETADEVVARSMRRAAETQSSDAPSSSMVPPAKARRISTAGPLFTSLVDGNQYKASCTVLVGDRRPLPSLEVTPVANSMWLPKNAAMRYFDNSPCFIGPNCPVMNLGQSNKRITHCPETGMSLVDIDCHSVTTVAELWGANRYLLHCPVEKVVFTMRDRNFNCRMSIAFHRLYLDVYGRVQDALLQFGQGTSDRSPETEARYFGHREVLMNYDRPESFTPAAKQFIGQTTFILVATSDSKKEIMLSESGFNKYCTNDLYNVVSSVEQKTAKVIRHDSTSLFGREPLLNLGGTKSVPILADDGSVVVAALAGYFPRHGAYAKRVHYDRVDKQMMKREFGHNDISTGFILWCRLVDICPRVAPNRHQTSYVPATDADLHYDRDDGKGYKVTPEKDLARALESYKSRYGVEVPIDPFKDFATFSTAGGITQPFKMKEGLVMDPKTHHTWGTKQGLGHGWATRKQMDMAMSNPGEWGFTSSANIGHNTYINIGDNPWKYDGHFTNLSVTELLEAARAQRPFPMKDNCGWGAIFMAHEINLMAQHVEGQLGRNVSADAGGYSTLFRQSRESHKARAGLQLKNIIVAYVQVMIGNTIEVEIIDPRLMDMLLARENAALIAAENGSLNEYMGHQLPRGNSLGEANGTHFLQPQTGRLYHVDDLDETDLALSDDFGAGVAYHKDHNDVRVVPDGALLAPSMIECRMVIPRGHERNAIGYYLMRGPAYYHGPTTYYRELEFGEKPEWQAHAEMRNRMQEYEKSLRRRMAGITCRAPDGPRAVFGDLIPYTGPTVSFKDETGCGTLVWTNNTNKDFDRRLNPSIDAILQVRTFRFRYNQNGDITGISSECGHFTADQIEPHKSRDVCWASPVATSPIRGEDRKVGAHNPRLLMGPVPGCLEKHGGPNGDYDEPLHNEDVWGGDGMGRRLFPDYVQTSAPGVSPPTKEWNGKWRELEEPEDANTCVQWAHDAVQRGDPSIMNIQLRRPEFMKDPKIAGAFLDQRPRVRLPPIPEVENEDAGGVVEQPPLMKKEKRPEAGSVFVNNQGWTTVRGAIPGDVMTASALRNQYLQEGTSHQNAALRMVDKWSTMINDLNKKWTDEGRLDMVNYGVPHMDTSRDTVDHIEYTLSTDDARRRLLAMEIIYNPDSKLYAAACWYTRGQIKLHDEQ